MNSRINVQITPTIDMTKKEKYWLNGNPNECPLPLTPSTLCNDHEYIRPKIVGATNLKQTDNVNR